MFFERYAQVLYGYACQAWNIDEDSAWDLIYKVLFKVTERINEYEFKSETQFKNFIYTLFKNELINWYKRNNRFEERLKLVQFDDLLMDVAQTDPQLSTEREVNTNSFKRAMESYWSNTETENPLMKSLTELIEKLDDWERILVRQRAMGYSYREISAFVDKPEEQLKVYYARLKKKIKNQLLQKIREMENE